MDRAEDHLWWYRSLHAYLTQALLDSHAPPDAPILDAGCGSGGLLRALGSATHGRTRIGLERFEPAAHRAQAKSGATILIGTVDALPFMDNSFGAIISADVLYHRQVDPVRATQESFRCLKPGGVLLVNVPAFQWLSSYHDQRVHGARRFGRRDLKQFFENAGLVRPKLHYWNSLLFPVMVARRLRPAAANTASDVEPLPRALDAALGAIVTLERRLIRLGIRFPAGGSILGLAYKP